MVARIRDISADITTINYGGLPYQLDDGRLAVCVSFAAPGYEGRVMLSEYPYTNWVSSGVDTGVAQTGRYFYRAKNGYLYFGTTRSNSPGKIIRSIDGGSTWQVVHTGLDGNSIWHITENSVGKLFANTYGTTLSQQIYTSTDNGTTWSLWLTVPDSILHIHGIYCDSSDNMLIGCGEWYSNRQTGCTATWAAGVATITCPAAHKAVAGGIVHHNLFSLSGYNGPSLPIATVVDATSYTVAITNDPGGAATGGRVEPQYYNGAIRRVTDNGATGTIGTLISYVGNGWIHMVEAVDGRLIFGWDEADGIIPVMMRGNSTLHAYQARMHDEVAAIGSFGFDGCLGSDGVIYMLYSNGPEETAVYASPDDGVSWQILRFGAAVNEAITNITCNPLAPNPVIFMSGNSGGLIRYFPDYTRADLRKRFAV